MYSTFIHSLGIIETNTNPGLYMPIGFAGGLHDRDVGWVRFGYRDYDPLTARFTAKDPLGYAAGDSDLRGYCFDDPVNGVDPLGLWTEVNYYDDNKGHLAVDPGANGDAFGKYPLTDSDIKGGKGEFRQETRTPSKTVRINTTPSQEHDMREYQSRAIKSNSVEYQLITNDCVDAADTILKVGGVTTPGSKGMKRPADYLE